MFEARFIGSNLWKLLERVMVKINSAEAEGGKTSCKGGGYGGDGRIRLDYSTVNGTAFPGGSASLTTPAAYMSPL